MATKKASGVSYSDDKVLRLPLKDILAPLDWNVRSGDWTADSGSGEAEEGGHEFKELKASIAQKGQDNPITVRPRGKKFEIVEGFRRFIAISQLADEAKDKDATIRAIVRDLNDIEARSLNLRENFSREDVNAPDAAFGIHDLYKMRKAEGGQPSSVSIASEVGLNQSYVALLIRIMEGLTTKLANAWRKSKVAVSLKDMDRIAKLDKAEQEAAYDKIVKNKDASTKGKGSWIDTYKKEAAKIGALIGRLELNELIDAESLRFETHIDVLFPTLAKKKPTAPQKRAIAKAAEEAWTAAKSGEDEETDEKEDKAAE